MIQNNTQSFKVTTNGRQATPVKWFILLIANAVVGGALLLFAYGAAWDAPTWFLAINGDVIAEILGLLLSASALVFAMLFIIDTLRVVFRKYK